MKPCHNMAVIRLRLDFPITCLSSQKHSDGGAVPLAPRHHCSTPPDTGTIPKCLGSICALSMPQPPLGVQVSFHKFFFKYSVTFSSTSMTCRVLPEVSFMA